MAVRGVDGGRGGSKMMVFGLKNGLVFSVKMGLE